MRMNYYSKEEKAELIARLELLADTANKTGFVASFEHDRTTKCFSFMVSSPEGCEVEVNYTQSFARVVEADDLLDPNKELYKFLSDHPVGKDLVANSPWRYGHDSLRACTEYGLIKTTQALNMIAAKYGPIVAINRKKKVAIVRLFDAEYGVRRFSIRHVANPDGVSDMELEGGGTWDDCTLLERDFVERMYDLDGQVTMGGVFYSDWRACYGV